jgi:uncharacterized Zn finger protein
MLARLDRSDEAVDYASKHLRTPQEGLAVVEALREQGDAEAALVVGEQGLSLEGRKSRLAGWVRDLVGDAIAAVGGNSSGGLVGRVADAAIESHSDWVIETCGRQAEEIMNQGRSKDYDGAVDWLAKVRDANLAAGREEEWLAYLAELIDHHQRKYKLRPMLEDLK